MHDPGAFKLTSASYQQLCLLISKNPTGKSLMMYLHKHLVVFILCQVKGVSCILSGKMAARLEYNARCISPKCLQNRAVKSQQHTSSL